MSKKRIKGNTYDRVSYSIPFYTNLVYFKPEGEDDDGETKEVKIPLKINPKEGDSKLNMTYLVVRAIEHWDNNIELVLDNFTCIDDKIMPSRTNGKAKDDIKMNKIIYIDTLCTSKMTLLRPSRNKPEMMSLFKSKPKSRGIQLRLRLRAKELLP